MKEQWKADIGGSPTAPVIADGRVIVASKDTHTIVALGADEGRMLWRYTAGARIDTPPTLHKGLALFGSADGNVYALRAKDGELAWRFRAAPGAQLLMNREQLESPWPVHGAVLVQDDVAYVTAGRSSFLDGGVRIYALDPLTGKVLRESTVHTPDHAAPEKPGAKKLRYDMPRAITGALSDVLVGDGSRVFMRHLSIDPRSLAVGNAIDAIKNKGKGKSYPGRGT